MDNLIGLIITGVVVLFVLIVILSSIKIVNTGYLYVVERFGQYHKTLEPGWHFLIPFADFVRKKVSTKQQILDVPPQSVITKDNVEVGIEKFILGLGRKVLIANNIGMLWTEVEGIGFENISTPLA